MRQFLILTMLAVLVTVGGSAAEAYVASKYDCRVRCQQAHRAVSDGLAQQFPAFCNASAMRFRPWKRCFNRAVAKCRRYGLDAACPVIPFPATTLPIVQPVPTT